MGGSEHRGATLVVANGTRHALELAGGLVVLLEPEGSLARALRDRWLGAADVAVVEPPLAAAGPEDALERLAETATTPPDARDPRVARVLAWLDEMEATARWPDVDLAAALGQVHLSEGRFRHLFADQVGSSWRGYLVWRRALVAASAALGGASLTEAAHAAGYADSAHLSRQFKQLFGFTPSRAVGFSRYVQG
ncbi:MAG: hypothetical protein CMN30_19385 [Sandaracinus sp.]|nr:hypothetical protein [Sandaracinus sp.]